MSLVELIVALAVIGILVALALPQRNKVTDQAKDTVARANLRTALMAELQYYESKGSYTMDRQELLAFEPGLPLGEQGAAGSIFIVVGHSRARPAVCLFTQGGSGWYTLYHSGSSNATVDLGGPNDCTRHMLDEQTGDVQDQKPGERPPGQRADTTGAHAITGDTVRSGRGG